MMANRRVGIRLCQRSHHHLARNMTTVRGSVCAAFPRPQGHHWMLPAPSQPKLPLEFLPLEFPARIKHYNVETVHASSLLCPCGIPREHGKVALFKASERGSDSHQLSIDGMGAAASNRRCCKPRVTSPIILDYS